jgi:citrate synthase
MFEAIHAALGRSGKDLPINLAGMIAAVYCELGFDPVEIEALAAVGYGYAITAHVVEEIREGVPLRIIPDALGANYIGPEERHIPDDR